MPLCSDFDFCYYVATVAIVSGICCVVGLICMKTDRDSVLIESLIAVGTYIQGAFSIFNLSWSFVLIRRFYAYSRIEIMRENLKIILDPMRTKIFYICTIFDTFLTCNKNDSFKI